MKKLFMLLFVTVLGFGFVGNSNAAFTDIGNNVGYLDDPGHEIYWYLDYASDNGAITYDEAFDWADQLVHDGHADWRLPTLEEFIYINSPPYNFGPSEYGFTEDPFTDIPAAFHWLSTPPLPSDVPAGEDIDDIAIALGLPHGDPLTLKYVLPKDTLAYASAVRSPVPIPSAVWLLGSGLIGLVGFRRKFREV